MIFFQFQAAGSEKNSPPVFFLANIIRIPPLFSAGA
jgi:hypothetical protein